MHVKCIRFVFFKLIDNDLKKVRSNWNSHRIRRTPYTNTQIRPSGRPNVLFHIPNLTDPTIQDHKLAISNDDIRVVEELSSRNVEISHICSDQFMNLLLF